MIYPMRRALAARCCARAIAAFALLALGCGEGEQRARFPISGTVTYRGKPVQMGSIRFAADISVGDFAPVCSAEIKDGQYRTKPDESPTNGRYQVQVMAIDVARIKKAPGVPDEMPALFLPYSLTVEVPPPDGKFDIEVPERRGR